MKIRIRENSVRIRLSKSEVGLLLEHGYLEEATDFGETTFRYAVKSVENENMSADFINNNIIIYVPKVLLGEWGTGDQINIASTRTVGNGTQLRLLVEKDFKCASAEDAEDQSDYFENPGKTC